MIVMVYFGLYRITLRDVFVGGQIVATLKHDTQPGTTNSVKRGNIENRS